MIDILKASCR